MRSRGQEDAQPLDVGADRIARTAHTALRLLGGLRKATGQATPLAWTPEEAATGTAAIEVYPAATLTAHGLRPSSHKQRSQVTERDEILRGLASELVISTELHASLRESADALDAAVCVLAAQDFLAGHAMPATDRATAEREGWTWVRRPLASCEPPPA